MHGINMMKIQLKYPLYSIKGLFIMKYAIQLVYLQVVKG